MCTHTIQKVSRKLCSQRNVLIVQAREISLYQYRLIIFAVLHMRIAVVMQIHVYGGWLKIYFIAVETTGFVSSLLVLQFI